MIITLANRFHNTQVSIRVTAKKDGDEFYISRATQSRMARALCGIKGCTCGGMVKSIGKYDYNVVGETYNREIIAQLVEKYSA